MNNDVNDRDFERRYFVGNYQRCMSHFYGIGRSPDNKRRFAFGYVTPDGVFHQGVTVCDADCNFTDEYCNITI